jgi:hypothetical protein
MGIGIRLVAEHAVHEVSSGNPSRSKTDGMEAGHGSSVNRDRYVLSRLDTPEGPLRLVLDSLEATSVI